MSQLSRRAPSVALPAARRQTRLPRTPRAVPALSLGLALLFTSTAPRAGNGAVAYALPAEGIVADGSLDDWPADPLRERLSLIYYGNPPSDANDLRAHFRVAYQPGGTTVWVAVEVEDESHQVEKEGRTWWNDDHCVVYFDRTHSPAGSGPIAFAMAGSRKVLSGYTGIPWDPAVAAGTWDDATGAIRREGTRTIYEFAIDTGTELQPHRALGMDVVVIDLDEGDPEEDGSYLSWGKGLFKNRIAGGSGAVVLLDADATLGTLIGEVRWSEDASQPDLETVRITSVEDERLWLDVALDENRIYTVKLPPGSYRIEPTQLWLEQDEAFTRIADGALAAAAVEADTELAAEMLILDIAPEPELFEDVGLLAMLDAPDVSGVSDVSDTSDGATPEATAEATLDRFLDAWMHYYQIPGTSIAIVRRGQLLYAKNLGFANALTREPVTDATLFEAASVTKAVFAFAVLRLVERGTIDLDRPLYLDLPFPRLTHDERHKLLTPRIVLTHRSGLPNWGDDGENDSIDFRFDPGTDYGYSGEAFQYLGRVAAKLDGRTIEQILVEEALVPMHVGSAEDVAQIAETAKVAKVGGLAATTDAAQASTSNAAASVTPFAEHSTEQSARTTCFYDTPALRRTAARGHRLGGPTRGNLPPEIGVAHSMYSNARELSAFLIGLLEGRGLNEATYREALRIHTERPLGEIAPDLNCPKGFGLGFMLMESPHGLIFGHDGNNGDFRSNLEAYRDLDAGFVLFANHTLGGELSNQVRRLLLGPPQ